MRGIVRALIESGVDVIKILATERAGLQEADPRRRTFTDEELVAATDAATRGGRAVMAHAHGDEGRLLRCEQACGPLSMELFP